MLEPHSLAVPDEAAAIEATIAWQKGQPPARRPFGPGGDTSGIATGGVRGQCQKANGKLLVLAQFFCSSKRIATASAPV